MVRRYLAWLAPVSPGGSFDGADCDIDQARQLGAGILRATALWFQEHSNPRAQVSYDAGRSRRPVRGATHGTKRSAGHSPGADLALAQSRRTAAANQCGP